MFDTWFRRYRPTPQPWLRLVCFPHAGGGAGFYRPWVRWLPEGIDMLAVQYPGRWDRSHEQCVDTMDELADRVADAVAPALDVPVMLFGHSLGAVVAYEVARRLERHPRCTLVHLFVSGRPAPQHHRRCSIDPHDDDALLSELRRLGGTSELVLAHPEMRTLVMSTVRSDYRLSDTYRPTRGAILTCPTTACIGDCDPDASVDEVLSWADVTHGSFQLRVFPGDHFYLVRRRAELIAELLRCGGVAPTAELWP